VSAFAVDDEKVANKKFAFTCPKCSSENIIDNRIVEKKEEMKLQPEESFFNDDFSIDTESPEKEQTKSGAPDDLFFDNAPTEKKEEKFESFEDEFAAEFPEEVPAAKIEKKDRNLNLEIEESENFPGIEEEDIFTEKPSPDKKKKEDDLFAEVPAFEADDEFVSFDEKEPAKAPADEFDIELKDDLSKSEDEEIFFDDFEETAEKTAKKEASSKDDFLKEEAEFDFEDIDTETIPEDIKNEKEKKLSSQDDIDALFAEQGIEFDEKPISKQSEIDFEDEITVDLDQLDIELDETSLDTDIFEEPPKTAKPKEKPLTSDEDITLDIDNLDIDLDETSLDADMLVEPAATGKPKEKPLASEEDITLDIDNLDIDLDETSLEADIFEEPPKTAKPKEKPLTSDEDITLDIDNLDIDLDETSLEADIFEEPAAVKAAKRTDIEVASAEDEFNEDDIKLNLDDLDIDLEEIENRDLVFEDDLAEETAPIPGKKSKPLLEEEDEDESITIDLDTLEIDIADENKIIGDEISEEDEKLTLDDAGLTFDELTSEMEKPEFEEPVDEDIKLSLNDIDPNLTVDKISQSTAREKTRVSDTLDELPEIDLDEYDTVVRQEKSRIPEKSADEFEEDFVLFPETEIGKTEDHKHADDMFDYEESEYEKSTPEKGNTYFSIDFTLKYSRIGALLRLTFLYSLSMIPHFIVMFIYTILSSIVGFINQIVILSTGRCVEDFALVIENTTRYFLYMKTNIIGIVEDRPVYTGKENIDHPLQLDITYPVKYSKNFAILRLSIIGILLIMLPHLIIMSLLTLTIPVVYLAGIITVIATRRWPNILFVYLTKYFRYLAKISSFMTGLTDEYPPFSFD